MVHLASKFPTCTENFMVSRKIYRKELPILNFRKFQFYFLVRLAIATQSVNAEQETCL